MTDEELVFEIAKLQDFDPDFSYETYGEGVIYYYDAEGNTIPNYVKILSRTGAEMLLTMLTAINHHKE